MRTEHRPAGPLHRPSVTHRLAIQNCGDADKASDEEGQSLRSRSVHMVFTGEIADTCEPVLEKIAAAKQPPHLPKHRPLYTIHPSYTRMARAIVDIVSLPKPPTGWERKLSVRPLSDTEMTDEQAPSTPRPPPRRPRCRSSKQSMGRSLTDFGSSANLGPDDIRFAGEAYASIR